MSSSESTVSPPSATATSRTERLLVLDVLRGAALFGVLVVNLPFAALPMELALQPPADAPVAQLAAWALVKALAETKFVSLFSLLFGIGLVLQLGRAEARGASTGFYIRRLAILGIIGLGHGLLLWQGDILFPYAIAGAVLYLLRKRSPKTLGVIAAILLSVGLVLSTAVASLDDSGARNDQETAVEVQDDFAEMAELLGKPGKSWTEVEKLAWTEGPLSLTLSVRALEYLVWLALSSLISFNWHVLGLFCLGAALMKLGLLGSVHRPLHGRWAVWGLGMGLALESAALLCWFGTGFAPGLPNAAATLLHELGSLVLAAGYLGTIAFWVHGPVSSGLSSTLHRAASAVGRTALSSYLGQSVILNLLFPWYGLALWAQLDRWQLLALAVVIFAGQILIATAWLRIFAMGPCEWLWRWATYGKRSPLLRAQ